MFDGDSAVYTTACSFDVGKLHRDDVFVRNPYFSRQPSRLPPFFLKLSLTPRLPPNSLKLSLTPILFFKIKPYPRGPPNFFKN